MIITIRNVPITMEIELRIRLANQIWRSALPMSRSIAINRVPSIGILNTMAVRYREIPRLRLQV
jgi:hypothetical protein